MVVRQAAVSECGPDEETESVSLHSRGLFGDDQAIKPDSPESQSSASANPKGEVQAEEGITGRAVSAAGGS